MKSVKSSRVLNNQVTSLQWLDHALLGLLLPLLYAFFRPRVAVVVQRQWRRGTVISPLGREGRGRWCYCQTKGKRSRGGWIGRRRSGIGHCCRIVERVAADSSPGTSEPVIDLGNGEACIPGESNCLFLGRIGILEWRNSRSFLFVLLYCTYVYNTVKCWNSQAFSTAVVSFGGVNFFFLAWPSPPLEASSGSESSSKSSRRRRAATEDSNQVIF